MRTKHTVIIGAGQAGLAMSRCLKDRGIEHVVLERGRIAERWRSERWDSLRLLTPRWLSRLPGQRYEGDDPEGFMTREEVVDHLSAYARSFDAPVQDGVTVTSVVRFGTGYLVDTDRGSFEACNVVIATGDCQIAHVPECATRLPGRIRQIVPTSYRRPADLPAGGVMVVGASATGLQLALEIRASGRPVTLSVGRHTRLPRRYRGRDILTWLEEMGTLGERASDVHDLETSRGQPSLQLAGSEDRRSVDLGTALAAGIRLVGRTTQIDGPRVQFGDNLVEDIAASDFKLVRLLMRIDAYIAETGLDGIVPAEPPLELIDAPSAPTALDLDEAGIRSVVWATGFRRHYGWLHVPVLDERGELRHVDGVTEAPGLYAMGLRFLRRRSSSFIDGQHLDAEELADHIAARSAREEVTA